MSGSIERKRALPAFDRDKLSPEVLAQLEQAENLLGRVDKHLKASGTDAVGLIIKAPDGFYWNVERRSGGHYGDELDVMAPSVNSRHLIDRKDLNYKPYVYGWISINPENDPDSPVKVVYKGPPEEIDYLNNNSKLKRIKQMLDAILPPETKDPSVGSSHITADTETILLGGPSASAPQVENGGFGYLDDHP